MWEFQRIKLCLVYIHNPELCRQVGASGKISGGRHISLAMLLSKDDS